jgi:hypothetical protein
MRDIADTVRDKQHDMARAILPKHQADALIQHLATSDKRYRNAIMAGGDDIVQTIAKGGAKANQSKTAFEALAANDPTAHRAMTAMVKAEQGFLKKHGLSTTLGGTAAALAYAAAHVPVVNIVAGGVATTVGLYKAKEIAANYMALRGAGDKVTFKELVLKDNAKTKAVLRRTGAEAGSITGARASEAYVNSQ